MKNQIHIFILLAVVASFCCCQQKASFELDLDKSPEAVEMLGEGFISTGLYERDFAISPDGNEFIYSIGDYKQTLRSLVVVQRNESSWGEKQILPFSGRYNDIEPFYSPDGKQLFFASDRPDKVGSDRNDYNIWVCQKMNDEWNNPVLLDTIINSKQDEYFPSVAENGNLYFTATRINGVGREDIFVSSFIDGAYQEAIPLDTNVNSASFEFNAYIHPKEEYLIFGSFGRADGLGGGDLYISRKDTQDHWTPAKNLGAPINSASLDYCPFVDVSTGVFYFTSERSENLKERISSLEAFTTFSNQPLNGLGNIYRVGIKKLIQQ
jgi:hypothetical protein